MLFNVFHGSVSKPRWLLSTAILPFLASASHATFCNPDLSSVFEVHGVAKDDTLNVRSGPTTNYPVIEELRPNAQGIGYGGDQYFLDWECQKMCKQVSNGSRELYDDLLDQCFENNLVWVEIVTPAGGRGWVSAKFLSVRTTDGDSVETQPTVQPKAIDPTSNVGAQEQEDFRDFLISHLFLELCNEGNYISQSNCGRIDAKYRKRISETSMSSAQIEELREKLKSHDAYQLMLVGLISQNGGSDPYWREQCNGITAGFIMR